MASVDLEELILIQVASNSEGLVKEKPAEPHLSQKAGILVPKPDPLWLLAAPRTPVHKASKQER